MNHKVVVLIACATLMASGCHSWQERPSTVATPVIAAEPVRVTMSDREWRVTLERVTILPDSVVGYLTRAEKRRGLEWVRDSLAQVGGRTALATADIRRLDQRAASTWRTMVLLGMLIVVGTELLRGWGSPE